MNSSSSTRRYDDLFSSESSDDDDRITLSQSLGANARGGGVPQHGRARPLQNGKSAPNTNSTAPSISALRSDIQQLNALLSSRGNSRNNSRSNSRATSPVTSNTSQPTKPSNSTSAATANGNARHLPPRSNSRDEHKEELPTRSSSTTRAPPAAASAGRLKTTSEIVKEELEKELRAERVKQQSLREASDAAREKAEALREAELKKERARLDAEKEALRDELERERARRLREQEREVQRAARARERELERERTRQSMMHAVSSPLSTHPLALNTVDLLHSLATSPNPNAASPLSQPLRQPNNRFFYSTNSNPNSATNSSTNPLQTTFNGSLTATQQYTRDEEKEAPNDQQPQHQAPPSQQTAGLGASQPLSASSTSTIINETFPPLPQMPQSQLKSLTASSPSLNSSTATAGVVPLALTSTPGAVTALTTTMSMQKLQEALDNERDAHSQTKEALSKALRQKTFELEQFDLERKRWLTEREELKEKLRETTTRYEHLQSVLDEERVKHSNDASNLHHSKSSSDLSMNNLKRERDELLQSIQQEQDKNATLFRQMQALKDESFAAKNAHDLLANSANELRKSLSSLQTNFDSNAKELEALKETYSEFKKQTAAQMQEHEKQMKDQLMRANMAEAQLKATKDLNASLNTSAMSVGGAGGNNSALSLQAVTQNSLISRYEAQVSGLILESESLKISLSDAERRTEKARERERDLVREIDESRLQREHSQKELEMLHMTLEKERSQWKLQQIEHENNTHLKTMTPTAAGSGLMASVPTTAQLLSGAGNSDDKLHRLKMEHESLREKYETSQDFILELENKVKNVTRDLERATRLHVAAQEEAQQSIKDGLDRIQDIERNRIPSLHADKEAMQNEVFLHQKKEKDHLRKHDSLQQEIERANQRASQAEELQAKTSEDLAKAHEKIRSQVALVEIATNDKTAAEVALNNSLSDLKKVQMQLDEVRRNLDLKNHEMESKIKDYNNLLKNQDIMQSEQVNTVEKLEERISDLKDELANSGKLAELHTEKHDILEKNIKDLEDKLSSAHQSHASKESFVHSQTASLKAMQELVERVQKEKQEVLQSNRELVTQKEALQEKINKMEEKANSLLEHITTKEDKIDQLNLTMKLSHSDSDRKLKTANNEKTDLSNRIATLQADLKEKSQANEDYKMDIATLNAELIDKEKAIMDLKKSQLIPLQENVNLLQSLLKTEREHHTKQRAEWIERENSIQKHMVEQRLEWDETSASREREKTSEFALNMSKLEQKYAKDIQEFNQQHQETLEIKLNQILALEGKLSEARDRAHRADLNLERAHENARDAAHQFENEKAALEREKTHLNKNIEELNGRYSILSNEKKSVMMELEDAGKRYKMLTGEKDKLTNELQVTLDAKFQSERETKAQELISKHWQERYESLIREQNQSENEWNNRWNRLLGELENERSSKHASTSEQANENHKLQSVILTLENVNKTQTKELAQLKEAQLALKLQVSTAAAELNELKHVCDSTKLQLSAEKLKSDKLADSESTLREANKQQVLKCNELEASLLTLQREKQRLEFTTQQHESHIKLLATKGEDLTSSLERRAADEESLRDEIVKLKRRTEEHENERKTLRDQLRGVSREAALNVDLQATITTLESNLKDMDEKLKSSNEARLRAVKDANDWQSQAEKVAEEKRMLEKNIAHLQEVQASLSDSLDSHVDKNSLLETKEKAFQALKDSWTVEKETWNKSLRESQSALDQTKADADKLKTESEKLRAQLQELEIKNTKQVKELEDQNLALTKELEEANNAAMAPAAKRITIDGTRAASSGNTLTLPFDTSSVPPPMPSSSRTTPGSVAPSLPGTPPAATPVASSRHPALEEAAPSPIVAPSPMLVPTKAPSPSPVHQQLLRQFELQIADLERENVALSQAKAELESKLSATASASSSSTSAASNEKDSLSASIAAYQKEIAELKAKAANATIPISVVSAAPTSTSKEANLLKLQHQLEARTRELAQANSEASISSKSLEENLEKLHEARKERIDLVSQIEKLELLLEQKDKALLKSNVEVEELLSELRTLKDTLKTEENKYTKAAHELKLAQQTLERQRRTLQEELSAQRDHTRELHAATQSASELELELHAYEVKMSQAESEKEHLVFKLSQAEEKLRQLNEKHNRMTRDHAALNLDHANVESKHIRLMRETEARDAQLREMDAQAHAREKHVTQLEAQRIQLEDEIADMRRKKFNSTRGEDLAAAIKGGEAVAQLAELSSELEAMEFQLKQARTREEEQRKEVQRLLAERASLLSANAAAVGAADTATLERLRTTQEDFLKLQDELIRAKDLNAQQEKQLTAYEEEIAKHQTALTTNAGEIEKLRSALIAKPKDSTPVIIIEAPPATPAKRVMQDTAVATSSGAPPTADSSAASTSTPKSAAEVGNAQAYKAIQLANAELVQEKTDQLKQIILLENGNKDLVLKLQTLQARYAQSEADRKETQENFDRLISKHMNWQEGATAESVAQARSEAVKEIAALKVAHQNKVAEVQQQLTTLQSNSEAEIYDHKRNYLELQNRYTALQTQYQQVHFQHQALQDDQLAKYSEADKAVNRLNGEVNKHLSDKQDLMLQLQHQTTLTGSLQQQLDRVVEERDEALRKLALLTNEKAVWTVLEQQQNDHIQTLKQTMVDYRQKEEANAMTETTLNKLKEQHAADKIAFETTINAAAAREQTLKLALEASKEENRLLEAQLTLWGEKEKGWNQERDQLQDRVTQSLLHVGMEVDEGMAVLQKLQAEHSRVLAAKDAQMSRRVQEMHELERGWAEERMRLKDENQKLLVRLTSAEREREQLKTAMAIADSEARTAVSNHNARLALLENSLHQSSKLSRQHEQARVQLAAEMDKLKVLTSRRPADAASFHFSALATSEDMVPFTSFNQLKADKDRHIAQLQEDIALYLKQKAELQLRLANTVQEHNVTVSAMTAKHEQTLKSRLEDWKKLAENLLAEFQTLKDSQSKVHETYQTRITQERAQAKSNLEELQTVATKNNEEWEAKIPIIMQQFHGSFDGGLAMDELEKQLQEKEMTLKRLEAELSKRKDTINAEDQHVQRLRDEVEQRFASLQQDVEKFDFHKAEVYVLAIRESIGMENVKDLNSAAVNSAKSDWGLSPDVLSPAQLDIMKQAFVNKENMYLEKLEKASTQITAVQQEVARYQSELTIKEQSQKESSAQSLRDRLAATQNSSDAAYKFREDIANLQSNLALKEAELKSVKDKLKTAEATIEDLNVTIVSTAHLRTLQVKQEETGASSSAPVPALPPLPPPPSDAELAAQERAREEKAALESSIQNLEKDIMILQDKIRKLEPLEGQLLDAQAKISTLNSQLNAAKAEASAAAVAAAGSSTDLQKDHARQLKQAVDDALDIERHDTKAAMAILKDKVAQREAELQASEKDLFALRKQLSEADEKARIERDNFQVRLSKLQGAWDENESLISAERKQWEEEKAGLEAQLVALSKERDTVREEKENISKMLNASQVNQMALETQIMQLQQELLSASAFGNSTNAGNMTSGSNSSTIAIDDSLSQSAPPPRASLRSLSQPSHSHHRGGVNRSKSRSRLNAERFQIPTLTLAPLVQAQDAKENNPKEKEKERLAAEKAKAEAEKKAKKAGTPLVTGFQIDPVNNPQRVSMENEPAAAEIYELDDVDLLSLSNSEAEDEEDDAALEHDEGMDKLSMNLDFSALSNSVGPDGLRPPEYARRGPSIIIPNLPKGQGLTLNLAGVNNGNMDPADRTPFGSPLQIRGNASASTTPMHASQNKNGVAPGFFTSPAITPMTSSLLSVQPKDPRDVPANISVDQLQQLELESQKQLAQIKVLETELAQLQLEKVKWEQDKLTMFQPIHPGDLPVPPQLPQSALGTPSGPPPPLPGSGTSTPAPNLPSLPASGMHTPHSHNSLPPNLPDLPSAGGSGYVTPQKGALRTDPNTAAIAQLQHTLMERNATIKSLEADKKNLMERVLQGVKESKESNASPAKPASQYTDAQYEQLKAQYDGILADNKQFAESKRVLEAQVAQLSNEVESLKASLKEMESNLQITKTTNATLQTELQKAAQTKETLQQSYDSLVAGKAGSESQAVAQLASKQAEWEKERVSLLEQLKKSQSDLTTSQAAVETSKTELASTQTSLQQVKQTLASQPKPLDQAFLLQFCNEQILPMLHASWLASRSSLQRASAKLERMSGRVAALQVYQKFLQEKAGLVHSSGSLRPLNRAELERRLSGLQSQYRAADVNTALSNIQPNNLPSVSSTLSKKASPAMTPKNTGMFRLKSGIGFGYDDQVANGATFASSAAAMAAARYAALQDREVAFEADPLKANPNLPPALPDSDRSHSSRGELPTLPPMPPENPSAPGSLPPSIPGSAPGSLPPSLPPSLPGSRPPSLPASRTLSPRSRQGSFVGALPTAPK